MKDLVAIMIANQEAIKAQQKILEDNQKAIEDNQRDIKTNQEAIKDNQKDIKTLQLRSSKPWQSIFRTIKSGLWKVYSFSSDGASSFLK